MPARSGGRLAARREARGGGADRLLRPAAFRGIHRERIVRGMDKKRINIKIKDKSEKTAGLGQANKGLQKLPAT